MKKWLLVASIGIPSMVNAAIIASTNPYTPSQPVQPAPLTIAMPEEQDILVNSNNPHSPNARPAAITPEQLPNARPPSTIQIPQGTTIATPSGNINIPQGTTITLPQNQLAGAPQPQQVAAAPQAPAVSSGVPANSAQAKRQAAFELLLDQALPLSPDQIKELRRLYDLAEEARFTTPKAPPTPISSSTRVNLEPGNTPPLIRLSAGFVSSLVFTDSTGSPWPIASYGIGDPQAFNIQWDQVSNTLFVQSLKIYAHGNLAVRLKDLSTPIMLTLVSGQSQVDYRIDLQVAGRGPQATAPIIAETITPAQVNPMLISFLDGVPPAGSIKLDAGRYGDAWTFKNKLYFRTKLKLLSPAWSATVSSPDGTHVYEMMKTPLILATDEGKTVNIQLKGL